MVTSTLRAEHQLLVWVARGVIEGARATDQILNL